MTPSELGDSSAAAAQRSEAESAIELANRILDGGWGTDPDSDICILARQLLRKHEALIAIVKTFRGSVFIPARALASVGTNATLTSSYNKTCDGYDVTLKEAT